MSSILARAHWVFDLDGTLTEPAHDFAAIRQELEIPPESDILGHLDELPEAEARERLRRLDEIEIAIAARAKPAAGAAKLMAALAERGVRVGILTRNTRDNAWTSLTVIGLDAYFDREAVIGRDEAEPKPHPDGVLKLQALWGAEAEDVVVVGDYLFDLQTGRAAGAATVHVYGGVVGRWPEWTDLGVESLHELVGGRLEAGG